MEKNQIIIVKIIMSIFLFMFIFIFAIPKCHAIFKHSDTIAFKIKSAGISPTCSLSTTSLVGTSVGVTFSTIDGGVYTTQYKTSDLSDFQAVPINENGDAYLLFSSNNEIEMRYSDGAGNISPIGICIITNIDNTFPSLTFNPNSGGQWKKGIPTIINSTDSSGIDKILYQISTSSTIEPTGIWTEISGNGETEVNTTVSLQNLSGTFYIWAKSQDILGNLHTKVSGAFLIDNTPPEISIENTSLSANAINLEVTSSDVHSGVSGYYYYISSDDGVTWTKSSKQGLGTYIYGGLENDKTYKLKVEVEDNVGIKTESNIIEVTTASIGSITISVDNDSWAKSKTVSVVFNDPLETGITYQYSTNGTAWMTITSDSTITYNQNGIFKIRITEGLLNETHEYIIDHIDPHDPVIDSFELDLTTLACDSFTLTASGHDADITEDGKETSGIAGYSFSIDGGATWSAVTANNTYSFDGLNPITDYNAKVRIYDNVGNYTEETKVVTTANDEFRFNPTTGVISGIDGFIDGSRMVMPAIIDGVTVTSIANNAFKNKNISSVQLPVTINSIGSYAFYQSPLVQDNLVIPEGVTSIGVYAFQSTSKNIETLTIESDVINLQQSCFNNGTIENVVIKGEATIGTAVFKTTNIKTVDLGHTVSVGYESFQNNPIVQDTLIIPSECNFIDRNAFNSSNKNIGTVILENPGVIDLGIASFANGKITNVVIKGEASIGGSAFSAAQIETLDLGNTTTIAAGSFKTNKLTILIIPSNVTTIANNAFSGSPNLVSIIVNNIEGAIANAKWGAPTGTPITYTG